MLIGIPIDVCIAATHFVTPLEQFDVVFGGVIAVPVNPVVVGDASFFVGRPNFYGPKQGAQMFVHPVLRACDHFFGVVLEVVKNTDCRVACQLAANVGHALDDPQIFGGHVGVALCAHGPQNDAGVGVKADRSANVGMLGNEVHHGAHLGLAGGVGASAQLLKFLAPKSGKVTV